MPLEDFMKLPTVIIADKIQCGNNILKIKKCIFNDPATVVFWEDGTKTVVKAQNDEEFDPEKGLAMAIAKKALGNTGNYYNVFKKCINQHPNGAVPEERNQKETPSLAESFLDTLSSAIDTAYSTALSTFSTNTKDLKDGN